MHRINSLPLVENFQKSAPQTRCTSPFALEIAHWLIIFYMRKHPPAEAMVNFFFFCSAMRRGWRSPWAAFVATPCAPLKFKSFPQVHATGEFGTWNLMVFGVGQDSGVVFCWVACHKMLVFTPQENRHESQE